MATLNKKIDFAIIMNVKNANPNGDPLNGNRPRTDYEGLGEITDVCLKRKLRDRLVERYMSLNESEKTGQAVFVQSDDRKCDEAKSLKSRADTALGKELGGSNTAKKACQAWIDVRAFGQLFAFKSDKKKKTEDNDGDTGVSIGIRGPVTLQSAFSIEPVSVSSTQITKSVNAEDTKDGKRSSDTMGMKHRVDSGVYVTFGSMNPQLAERTLFSDDDAMIIKSVLPRIFENDASSARPEGSMEVIKVIWWEHNCKAGQYSSAKVHKSLSVKSDGTYELAPLANLKPEEIAGF
ncbi:MAG TPA: type I-C CRISPR-associated protein Cas7/Csd2 [Lentisphaeria bacterium]|nr:MAG: type I-C CRISPR-associated protein Cas7/Csd2 [Lentisphaerae bacterium GWF2_49_21]HBC89782.1 type I-C CRISPR-associated protein Cas7/Csd2 [Lentisphaeria bacterium]